MDEWLYGLLVLIIYWTSSHFPFQGSRAVMSCGSASPCITLRGAIEDVGLNYKGCHFQIRFTQSRRVLMINLLHPTHTNSPLKWKISLCVQVCFSVEFRLRLNSLLTAMNICRRTFLSITSLEENSIRHLFDPRKGYTLLGASDYPKKCGASREVNITFWNPFSTSLLILGTKLQFSTSQETSSVELVVIAIPHKTVIMQYSTRVERFLVTCSVWLNPALSAADKQKSVCITSVYYSCCFLAMCPVMMKQWSNDTVTDPSMTCSIFTSPFSIGSARLKPLQRSYP